MHDHSDPMIDQMRMELTSLGVQELRTPQEVARELSNKKGTLLIVVNSVCGCAAGNARPAVKMALKNAKLPKRLTTVFAGQDADATATARSYFSEYPPSSPSMVLFKDGKVVFMLPRNRIEGRNAVAISEDLVESFNTFC